MDVWVVSVTTRSGDQVVAVYTNAEAALAHAQHLNADPEALKRQYMDEGEAIIEVYPVEETYAG